MSILTKDEAALHYYVLESNVSEVEGLLVAGVRANAADSEGNRALHLLAILPNPSTAILDLLSSHDADFTLLNNDGKNPSTLALACGNKELADLMIRKYFVRELAKLLPGKLKTVSPAFNASLLKADMLEQHDVNDRAIRKNDHFF